MGGIYMLFITIGAEQVCLGEDPTLAFSIVTQYPTNFFPGCASNERVETTKNNSCDNYCSLTLYFKNYRMYTL